MGEHLLRTRSLPGGNSDLIAVFAAGARLTLRSANVHATYLLWCERPRRGATGSHSVCLQVRRRGRSTRGGPRLLLSSSFDVASWPGLRVSQPLCIREGGGGAREVGGRHGGRVG